MEREGSGMSTEGERSGMRGKGGKQVKSEVAVLTLHSSPSATDHVHVYVHVAYAHACIHVQNVYTVHVHTLYTITRVRIILLPVLMTDTTVPEALVGIGSSTERIA